MAEQTVQELTGSRQLVLSIRVWCWNEQSCLREGDLNLGLFSSCFILEDKLSCILSGKLDIGIKEFNPIDGSIRCQIDINLVAYMNCLNFSRFGMQAEVGDVVAGVVSEFHKGLQYRANGLIVAGHHRNHKPVFPFTHGKRLDLFGCVVPIPPDGVEVEIAPKPDATEFGSECFPFQNRRANLLFGCATF